MPREQLSIRQFGKGMIPNVDTSDLDPQAAFWCQNVDLLNREGQLAGLPGDENKTSTIGAVGNAQGHAWVQNSDRKHTLLYYDAQSDSVKYISDVYGTPGSVTELDTSFDSPPYVAMIPRNLSVRAGKYNASTKLAATPTWYGYTSNSIFGSSSTSIYLYDQECKRYQTAATNGHFIFTAISNNDDDADGFFRDDKRYYYQIALEYDGYQLSLLSTLTGQSIAPSMPYNEVLITLRAYGGATSPSSFNKRITKIYLFRAESSDQRTVPNTEYRLVSKIEFDDAGWATAGTDHKDITITDTGTEQESYEELSGLSQAATKSMINWRIGAECNGYLFVADCYDVDITEAPTMIFRSVAGKYDVFPVESFSFIKMQNIITCMVSFNNSLLAFDDSTMYRINPDGLAVEETLVGYGCYGPQSVIVTIKGVFFANNEGVHWYDGKQIQRISKPIYEYIDSVTYNVGGGSVTIADHSYRVMTTYVTSTNPIKLAYLAKHDLLLVASSVNGAMVMYGYCLTNNSWTLIGPPSTSAASSFSFITGKDGEIYVAYRVSTNNLLYKLMSDYSSRKLWTWLSQKINFNQGDEGQYQKIYSINVTESAQNGKFYGINGGTVSTSFTSSPAVASGDRKHYVMRFIVTAGATGRVINNITIIFRRMLGKRCL